MLKGCYNGSYDYPVKTGELAVVRNIDGSIRDIKEKWIIEDGETYSAAQPKSELDIKIQERYVNSSPPGYLVCIGLYQPCRYDWRIIPTLPE